MACLNYQITNGSAILPATPIGLDCNLNPIPTIPPGGTITVCSNGTPGQVPGEFIIITILGDCPEPPCCLCYALTNEGDPTNTNITIYTDCFGNPRSENLVTNSSTSGGGFSPPYQRCMRVVAGQNPQITKQWLDPTLHTTAAGSAATINIVSSNTSCSDNLYKRLNKPFTLFYDPEGLQSQASYNSYLSNYLSYYKGEPLYIVFMVRGVDPYSGKHKVWYDLSRLFGYDPVFNPNTISVVGDYYLNIPIQAGGRCVRHDQLVNNDSTQPDGNNGNATLRHVS